MEKTEPVKELKEPIISRLKLEDITVNDIGDKSPLFGDVLGLDSMS